MVERRDDSRWWMAVPLLEVPLVPLVRWSPHPHRSSIIWGPIRCMAKAEEAWRVVNLVYRTTITISVPFPWMMPPVGSPRPHRNTPIIWGPIHCTAKAEAESWRVVCLVWRRTTTISGPSPLIPWMVMSGEQIGNGRENRRTVLLLLLRMHRRSRQHH